MKPFDLQAAIRHEPVVTRDGRPYTFGAYNPNAAAAAQIVGWVGDKSISHYQTGRRSCNDIDDFDLFMAPRKTELWLNLYRSKDGLIYHSHHLSESDALQYTDFNNGTVLAKAIKVEFEE